MESSSSIQDIIHLLRQGKDAAGYDAAITRLWEKYFLRMTLVAHRKMVGANQRVRDEEDIAVSAFKSFCVGLQAGKYQKDSNDLWPLLVTLTVRKAIDHLRHENRAKRGGNHEFAYYLEELSSHEVQPGLQMVADETIEHLFEALDATGDQTLRVVAALRLEDLTTIEIAQQLGCTMRTVQRKLKTIESIWLATNDRTS